ncbi:hypothetical protein D3C81_1485450 [compost metagenome]
MIEEIKFLYDESIMKKSIYSEFIKKLEDVFTIVKLVGWKTALCEYRDGSKEVVIVCDGGNIEIQFEFNQEKLSSIVIFHEGAFINNGSDEDFLITLDILLGAVSVA